MYLPPIRKVLPLLCAVVIASTAGAQAGEMRKFTKHNFALSLPDGWEDVTDTNPSKGLLAFFLAPDKQRMVLVFLDDKVPPVGGIDEKFIEEYEKNIGVTGGNKRLTGKLIDLQGVKSYERTGEGEWRGNTISTWSRTIPVGNHFYLIRAMIWNGVKADEDPQIFESVDSFRFLDAPGGGTAPSVAGSTPKASPGSATTSLVPPAATPAPAEPTAAAPAPAPAPAVAPAPAATTASVPPPAAEPAPAPSSVITPAQPPAATPAPQATVPSPAPEPAVPTASQPAETKPAEMTPPAAQPDAAPAPLTVPSARLSVKPRLPSPPPEATPAFAGEQQPQPAKASEPPVKASEQRATETAPTDQAKPEINPIWIYGGVGALVGLLGLTILIARRRKPVDHVEEEEELDDDLEASENAPGIAPPKFSPARGKSAEPAPPPFAPSFASDTLAPKGAAPAGGLPLPPPTMLPKQPAGPKSVTAADDSLPAMVQAAVSKPVPIAEPPRSILRPPGLPKIPQASIPSAAPKPVPIAEPPRSILRPPGAPKSPQSAAIPSAAPKPVPIAEPPRSILRPPGVPKSPQSAALSPGAPKPGQPGEPPRSVMRPPAGQVTRPAPPSQVPAQVPPPRLAIHLPKPPVTPPSKTVWEEPEDKSAMLKPPVPPAKVPPAPAPQPPAPVSAVRAETPAAPPPRLPLTPPEPAQPAAPAASAPATPPAPQIPAAAPAPAPQARPPQAVPPSMLRPPPPRPLVSRAPSAPPPPVIKASPPPPDPSAPQQPKAAPQPADSQPTVIRPASPKPATPQAPPPAVAPPAPKPEPELEPEAKPEAEAKPEPTPKPEPIPAAPASSKAMLIRPRQNTRIRGDQ